MNPKNNHLQRKYDGIAEKSTSGFSNLFAQKVFRKCRY